MNAPDAMTTCNTCEVEPMQPDSPAGQCVACEADARASWRPMMRADCHDTTVERADCPTCRECKETACTICTANHRPHAARSSMWQGVCGRCWQSEHDPLHAYANRTAAAR